MGVTSSRQVTRIEHDTRRVRHDAVAAEEPLEIRVGGRPVAVTMRTPGHDFELAAGFLLAEGVVGGADDIRAIRYCLGEEGRGRGDGTEQQYNVVDVVGPAPVEPTRAFPVTSACGLCGRSTIEAVRTRSRYDVAGDPVTVPARVLSGLPERLRSAQRVFERTGGLHAAGLFDARGELVCAREDVGRHNAFDKVVGWATLERRLPLRRHVIVASGRASFELVQKAVVAGIPVLAAVSAPSSLAVDLAAESGLTLVGFLRGETMNVYSGASRVT
jgi:FdhD protein